MDLGDSSRGGFESIARVVAMIRGWRRRGGIGSTRDFATGLAARALREVWRWFVCGVVDGCRDDDDVSFVEFVRGDGVFTTCDDVELLRVEGPACSNQARSNAERSRCPCSRTSSSRRASSSCVSRKPTCLVDAMSARAGRPMRRVYPRT